MGIKPFQVVKQISQGRTEGAKLFLGPIGIHIIPKRSSVIDVVGATKNEYHIGIAQIVHASNKGIGSVIVDGIHVANQRARV